MKAALVVPWATLDALEFGSKNKIGNECDAYSQVPIIYRAVRLRSNALVSVPLKVLGANGTELESYPFEKQLPLKDLIWKIETSLLLAGAAYVLELANEAGLKAGLQVINPFTMKVKKVNGQLLFWQEVDGTRYPSQGYWTEDELFYMREFNPNDDIGAGVSPTSVALMNAKLSNYLTRYSAQFFEGGGLPITMISLPAGIQAGERETVENWFKEKISALRNKISRVIAVSGETKINNLSQTFENLVIEKLDAHVIENVAYAFDIPKTVLTADSANFATANVEYKSFISDTIQARCKFFESTLNKWLINYGFKLEFDIQEMSVMQEDEVNRSGALKNLVDSGVPLSMAMQILGYDLPDAMTIPEPMKQPDTNTQDMNTQNNNMQDMPAKTEPINIHLHTEVKSPDIQLPEMKPNITVQPSDIIIEQKNEEVKTKQILLKRDKDGKLLSAEVK